MLFKSFVADINASKAGQIAGVNRKTADRYFNLFRESVIRDALKERKEAELANGIEVDESYFGPRRVRGKRGRGSGGKIIVFGMLKREGRVYTQIIKRAQRREIMPVIRKVVKSGSDIYSDGWKSYDALAVYGYNHKKVRHEDSEFAREDGTQINGVESYWSWTKRRLSKFNGMTRVQFQRYLLESEWRFNNRSMLESKLKKLLKFDS